MSIQQRAIKLAQRKFPSLLSEGYDLSARRPLVANAKGTVCVVMAHPPKGSAHRLGAMIETATGRQFWVK